MLPQHEPLDPAAWRAAWETASGAGLATVRIISEPGQPRGDEPFTGVTRVPFAMLCLAGRIQVRTASGLRFTLQPRDACIWAPGTWVACWHAECPRYLRATVDQDHVFAAMKDHDRRRRGGRLVDLYGVAVPGLIDPAARGLLGGLSAVAWRPQTARAVGELLFWAVHAHLGTASGPERTSTFVRLQALAASDPPPSRSAAARAVGVAAETVSRLCRRHGGCTWNDLVAAARLQRAELLLRGGSRLEVIAEACGFASAGHLIRRFRQRHGTTPERWRRSVIDQGVAD
jgi:AraC-like DNA-binding protein